MKNKFSRRSLLGAAVPAILASGAKGANDRIQIGIIGTGGRGQNRMAAIHACRNLNVVVTAICDVWRLNREKGVALATKYWGAKPRSTVDYQELLGWRDVDAVVITAPDYSHSVILKHAIEAGKDAYCEKPMGTVLSEAKAAYQAVKASDRVVQIGTQRRSDPYHISAARHLHAGILGKVTRVDMSVNFQQPRWRRDYSNVTAADVAWKYFLLDRLDRPFNARHFRQWQLFRPYTNGIAGLWMSHFIDLVPWFLGDPYPDRVVSGGGVYLWKDGRQTSDVFHALLEYPKGFLVSFSMSLTNGEGIVNSWYGKLGTLDLISNTISGKGSKDPRRIKQVIQLEKPQVNTHMANFIECIRSRAKPRADIQAGFSHAVADIMAATALHERREVRFDAKHLEVI